MDAADDDGKSRRRKEMQRDDSFRATVLIRFPGSRFVVFFTVIGALITIRRIRCCCCYYPEYNLVDQTISHKQKSTILKAVSIRRNDDENDNDVTFDSKCNATTKPV